MAKQKSPAYQMYAADWLASQRVSLMSLEEEGAYIRLLNYCWRDQSIPNNTHEVMLLCGKNCTEKIAEKIMQMFIVDSKNNLRLRHERLDIERKKQKDWSRKSSKGGKQSAVTRKNKSQPPLNHPCNGASTTLATNSQPTAQPKGNSSSSFSSSFSSSSSNKETITKTLPRSSDPNG